MKRWLLGLTLLAAGGVYFHFLPPPRYHLAQEDLESPDRYYRITFRTFPPCDIHIRRPESSESFGEPVARAYVPVELKNAGPQGTHVYYVYSRRARQIVSEHPTDWITRDQLEIPSDNLRASDLNWDTWPPNYLPKFLLTTRSAWETFASESATGLVDLAGEHWLITVSALCALALYGGRRAQSRRLAQRLAGSTQVGGYILKESLGKGGAGEVFRAIGPNEEAVALKILHSSSQDNPELRKRFQAEIKVCAKLNHPNIVHLLDWGQQNDILYLVMELLEGESLGDRLRRKEKLTHSEFLEILKPLADALQCLHQLGLVHRDLKPDNVFLRLKGGPALMDFGIAAGLDITRATRSDFAVGTPTYMAPEQIRGMFEPATDQYGLGVVSFICLTGRPPFEAADPAAMAYQHAHATPPRPSTLNPDVPAAADSVLMKMLAKNPGQRYPSIEEAAQALGDALAGRSFLDEGTIATSS